MKKTISKNIKIKSKEDPYNVTYTLYSDMNSEYEHLVDAVTPLENDEMTPFQTYYYVVFYDDENRLYISNKTWIFKKNAEYYAKGVASSRKAMVLQSDGYSPPGANIADDIFDDESPI